ncbi:MAG: glycosyl hydrolase family 28-related protein [Phycisphaerae bacterium]
MGAAIRGAGIQCFGFPWAPHSGGLTLVDSLVEITTGTPAVTSNRPVFISNSYFLGAPVIVELDGAADLNSAGPGWSEVAEYAGSPSVAVFPVWTEGERQAASVGTATPAAAPPAGLVDRHLGWVDPFPSWISAAAANVRRPPYLAAGDGLADDTDALQSAIDQSPVVFLPKGFYRIRRPLKLKAGTQLIGVGSIYSKILPDLHDPSSSFLDPGNPNPLVETVDDAAATTRIAFLELQANAGGVYALHWSAGRCSLVRTVRMQNFPWQGPEAAAGVPRMVIDRNGGGRFYNVSNGSQAGVSSLLRVEGTREPLAFYMLDPEHGLYDYWVDFQNVRNVTIFGFKLETDINGIPPVPFPPIRFEDSQQFRVLGYGGLGALPTGAFFTLNNCSDFRLANLHPEPKQSFSPTDYDVIADSPAGGPTVNTPATEYLVLYKRGDPRPELPPPPADCATETGAIPAVSQWGMIVMTLLLLSLGTIVMRRLRTA